MKLDKKFWGASLLLLVVSALVYLPKIANFGYYNDDWYLIYDAYTQGPSIYHEVFRGDRPMRAYVMIASYHLFGFNPLLYNLSAYFFRLLSGIGFLWTLRLLWKEENRATLITAILFLIYPGFFSLPNGIDYQSQMISLAFAMLSITFTLKFLLEEEKGKRIFYFLISFLLGWIYLGLVEYFIGFEVLRFGAIFLLASREKSSFSQKVFGAFKKGWAFLLIPFSFLFWRVFLFENERRATSISSQFGQLVASPIHTGLWWSVYTLEGLLEIIFLVWAVPLYSISFNLRLREALIGIGLASLLVFIVLFSLKKYVIEETPSKKAKMEALWLGGLSALGGILPIIMVNRHIDFFDYSRYTLNGSAGGAMVVVALLYFFENKKVRNFLLGLMLFSASFTHYANAIKLAQNTEATNNFWWQMSWRSPQIAEDTTMVIEYPHANLSEDYIVWGAANLLYYPDIPQSKTLTTPLSALLLTPNNVIDIQSQKGEANSDGRGYQSTRDFGNVLVLTQTTENGCLRALDGASPDLSSYDSYRIQLIAPYSKPENILTDVEQREPPEIVFGVEPPHKWCYYYQKASLARQQGDWDEVIKLQEKALDEGYYPADSIEWMPLLEAYAKKGEHEKIRRYISILREEPRLMQHACIILSEAAQNEETKTFIEKKFCE